jgi:hypothetical protein
MKQARGRHRLPHAYSFRNSSRSFAMLGAIRLSYFLGCLLRTKERYIRTKAASNTPPIDTYLEPNKTFLELREMIDKKVIDILGIFGEACREEFQSLQMGTV